MTQKLFALVDCNNFYASCERVFAPRLNKKPVVVLSNNDGCAIARSQEAKAAGIRMGHPIFQCQDLVKKHDITVFSANFVLYGDMSQRVMQTLSAFSPEMEIYSIDEAFLVLDGAAVADPDATARQIRTIVQQRTGLPVSVGIGPTKTLAKVANHIAKRKMRSQGYYVLTDRKQTDTWLNKTPVEKIWGIGGRRAKWLHYHGIENAYQLMQMPDAWLKKYMMVTGLRTVWELRGVPCLPLEQVPPVKKAIGTSRSFGYRVTRYAEMEEAVAAYTARTAEKLRKQKTLAGFIQVYVETDCFKPDDYYENSAGCYVDPPTAYTPHLVQHAQQLLAAIYRPGLEYKKAGVLLTHFMAERQEQQHFLEDAEEQSRQRRLMAAVDAYNRKTNSGKILFASEGLGKPWYMRQTRKSRRYTTRWDELLEI
jgi:DNA polymerase V